MEIILAAPRGFCAGVNMAVTSLDLAIKHFGVPIYVYHEIVHNLYVVETFKGQRSRLRQLIGRGSWKAKPCSSRRMEFRPRSAALATARKLFAIDATCPLVTKVHLEAIKYAKGGYTIVLIGHDGHDEVIGTMGEAPEAIVLVESEA